VSKDNNFNLLGGGGSLLGSSSLELVRGLDLRELAVSDALLQGTSQEMLLKMKIE
jgi:hypothetical protein